MYDIYGLNEKSLVELKEIALKLGFSETKTFCRVFKTVMGMTAGEYRKKWDCLKTP